MLAIVIVMVILGSATVVSVAALRIRTRRRDKERHRHLAKRKYYERELRKPRIPTKAPEPYLWKSDE